MDGVEAEAGVQVRLLDGRAALSRRTDVVAVYEAAFRLPPYDLSPRDIANFNREFREHVYLPGFRCAVAEEPDGTLTGFGYGFTGRPGQWWHDVVVGGLPRAQTRRWFHHFFELTDLAVDPQAQGLGLGGRLHDTLLEGLRQRTACLSTVDEDTVAYGLYLRRGWQVLQSNFYFPDVALPYRIMVIDLPFTPHV